MKLFIDTEFNDYKGDLISMALVDEDGREFYESLGCTTPSTWVLIHVMPTINKVSVSKLVFQKTLFKFLQEYQEIHLIADWPEDIQHFCNMLITGPGERIDTPLLTMEIRRDLDCSGSAIPHNALEDARALKAAYEHLARC